MGGQIPKFFSLSINGLKTRDFSVTALKKNLFGHSELKRSKAKCGLPKLEGQLNSQPHPFIEVWAFREKG